MKIEAQVCLLELSMRLKELGVKQDSLFCWCGEGDHIRVMLNETYDNECNPNYKICSAFTVAELGEMLPDSINEDFIKSQKKDDEYKIYIDNIDKIIIFFSKNEADARAKILIYLLENKLMELKNE